MLEKINNKNDLTSVAAHMGAWIMALATIAGSSETARQPAVLNTIQPAYAYVQSPSDEWARSENKEEVRMPTQYQTGMRSVQVSGKQ